VLKTSGIYCIENTASGHRYIGSAVNVANRFYEHRKHLRKGTHANSHLQHAWLKYGADAFQWTLVARCAPELLIAAEQQAIDRCVALHGRDRLYNICLVAQSALGVRRSLETRRRMSEAKRGKKHTAESCANMGASRRGKRRSPEAMAKTQAAHRGMKRSAECRAKMSAASARRDRSTWAKTPEHRAKIAAAMLGNRRRSPTPIVTEYY
jgi:group I intron endonuclease